GLRGDQGRPEAGARPLHAPAQSASARATWPSWGDAGQRRPQPGDGAAGGRRGVPLIEKTMDIAARFNWLNPSTDVGNENFYSVEGQLAYYAMHTQNLVVKARYGLGHQSAPAM